MLALAHFNWTISNVYHLSKYAYIFPAAPSWVYFANNLCVSLSFWVFFNGIRKHDMNLICSTVISFCPMWTRGLLYKST